MPLDLNAHIRDVPDFPKPGIVFKDITPLLANGAAFRELCDDLADRYRDRGLTHVVSVESRGFIFGAALAAALKIGFVPVRKPGKLPADTLKESYELEYGSDTLEIHRDAFANAPAGGAKVLVIDDVLATGGTLAATLKLVAGAGGETVEAFCLIELGFLNGRDKLGGVPFTSLMVL